MQGTVKVSCSCLQDSPSGRACRLNVPEHSWGTFLPRKWGASCWHAARSSAFYGLQGICEPEAYPCIVVVCVQGFIGVSKAATSQASQHLEPACASTVLTAVCAML